MHTATAILAGIGIGFVLAIVGLFCVGKLIAYNLVQMIRIEIEEE